MVRSSGSLPSQGPDSTTRLCQWQASLSVRLPVEPPSHQSVFPSRLKREHGGGLWRADRWGRGGGRASLPHGARRRCGG